MLDAANRANSWANQRKHAIEKAQKLKEERKFNLAKAGEMSMANEMGSTGLGRYGSDKTNYDFPRGPADDYLPRKPATMKYGMSMLDQAPSDEELVAARSSLKLLKSKMKDSNGFPSMPANNYGSSAKQKGYFEENTHEYMPNAPGNRRIEQDQNYNDMYQNPNNNYRKVFKPNIDSNDGYQPMARDNQSDARKTKALSQVNNYGPRDDYNPTSYGNVPQSKPSIGGKPPMGAGRYEPRGVDNYGQNAQEDFSDFKNVPSRIPKNTLASNKGKFGQPSSAAYEDDFGTQSKPRLGGTRNYESESPTIRGYQQQQNNDAYGGGYSQQQRAPAKTVMPQRVEPEANSGAKGFGNQNKGGRQNNAKEAQQEKDESYKDFSKPSFKKNVPPPVVEDRIKPAKQGYAIPNDPMDQGPDEGPMIECPQGCGRSFFQHALEKHSKICLKVFQKKRKQFDSAGQRALDEEAETKSYNPPAAKKGGKPAGKAGAGNKGMAATGSKWKQESEAFRANLRAARGGKLSQEEETALTKASQAGMVKCDHCGRSFNENAAARHIPFCQTKNKIDTIKKGVKPGRR